MLPETENRLTNLRQRVNATKAELDTLKTALTGNTDEYTNRMLRRAYLWFDDIETVFVAMLEEKPSIPRTFSEESRILDDAELALNQSISMVGSLQDLIQRYGTSVGVGGIEPSNLDLTDA